jgi:hypothetical protein
MHSSLKYGILFWGNVRNLKKVFELQKRAIRLIIFQAPQVANHISKNLRL